MAPRPDTTTGTITLTSGTVAFTATGVNLVTRQHLPGDTILRADGSFLVIETITSETAGTLRDVCPATAAGTQPARIRFQADGSRVAAQTRNLIDVLGNGTLQSIAGLDGTGGDKGVYLTGPNTVSTFALSVLARTLVVSTTTLAMRDIIGLDELGLGFDSTTFTNADNIALGSFGSWGGTDAQAAAAQLPQLSGGDSTPRWWNVISLGVNSRRSQIAIEVYGIGTTRGRTAERVRHDNTWYGWRETVFSDALVTSLAGVVSYSAQTKTSAEQGRARANIGAGVDNWNWIINPNFTVNVRSGVKRPANGVYGFDRWKGHANGIEQPVENMQAGEYTLTWTGGGTGTFGGITSASPIKATVAAGTASVIVPEAATRVSLVRGDATAADPYFPRQMQLEWALCEFYCELVNGKQFDGSAFSSSNLTWGIPYSRKRVVPSLTNLTFGSWVGSGVSGAIQNTIYSNRTTTGCSADCTSFTGSIAGGAGVAVRGSRHLADAEIY